MNNPRAIIAAVALEYVGLRETSRNRGPNLETFWKATNYPDGAKDRQPWCSAFVSFCVQEGDRRSPELELLIPPFFPAVAQWLPWANDPRNGCLVFTPEDVRRGKYKPEAGDVVSFLPHLSHIAIVRADWTGGPVLTVEGNTSPGKGAEREGDGCFPKSHPLSFCGHFIRVPARALAAVNET